MTAVINAKIDESNIAAKLGRKAASQMQKLLMHDIGEFWHAEIMPQHFQPNNKFAYQLSKRNELYLDEIKKEEGEGAGKETLLVLSGKSKRFAMAFVKISGTKARHTVTMSTPPYFTNPHKGPFQSKSGQTKTILNQPDKAKEATQLNSRDRNRMIRFALKRGAQIIDQGFSNNQSLVKG